MNDASMEKALLLLAETSEEYGALCGQVVWHEERLSIVRAQGFLEAEGTVAEREARAKSTHDYYEALEEYRDSVRERETLRARRAAASAGVEIWRSLQATKRAANV